MNLYTKIKQLFSPKKESDSTLAQTDNDKAQIKFILDETNNPYVKIVIADTSPETAIKIAGIIWDINSGKYAESIIQILIEMAGQDIEINKFVKRLFSEWSTIEYSRKPQNVSEPFIKPTDFFKALKNGT